MPDQHSKLILDGEDKTAAAFRSAARNAEMLNRAVGGMGRGMVGALQDTTRALDVLGFGFGKLATGVGVAEFARRSFTAFADLERGLTRAGLGLKLTREEMVGVRHELEKIETDTKVPMDQLSAAFGKMAASGSRSKNEIIEQMTDIAKAAKVAGIAPAEVAAGVMSLQRQFKFSNAEIIKVLDMMAVKPAGMASLIENAPKLALVMGQIGKGGVGGVREMIATINFMQKQLGSTEDAAQGLVQIMEMMFSDQLTHKLRDAGLVGNLQGQLKQARAEGKDVLALFVSILEKQGAFDEANESKFENIFGRRIQLAIRAMRDALTGVPKEMARLDAGAGQVNRAFKVMGEDSKESIDGIKIAVDQLMITLGELAVGAGVPAFLKVLTDNLKGLLSIIKLLKGDMTNEVVLADELEDLKKLEEQYKKEPTPAHREQLKQRQLSIESIRAKIHAATPAGQIEALQAQRDKIKKGLDELGPAAGVTYRSRMEKEMKALDESIKKLTDAIERKDQEDIPATAKPISYQAPEGTGGVTRLPGRYGMYVPGGPGAPGAVGGAPGAPGGGNVSPGRGGAGGPPGGPPGGSTGTQTYGGGTGKQQTAQTVANELREQGMPENAIAGMMANIQSESGFDPTLRHADQPKFGGEAHYAHGLFQEGGAEWNTWAADMQKRGLDPNTAWKDPKEQARFVAGRLKGTIGDNQYAGLYKRMTAEGVTKEQAAEMFVKGYLKPAQVHQEQRSQQYRRGVPGVESYTGPGTAAPGTAAPGSPAGGGRVTHEGTGAMVSPEIREAMEYAGGVAGVRTNIAHGDEAGHARHRPGASAGDVDLYDQETGRKLDSNIPADRAKMAKYIEAAAAGGATGIGMGGEGAYMGASRMHIGGGTPAVWGAKGKSANAPQWARDAYERGRKNQLTPAQRREEINAGQPNVQAAPQAAAPQGVPSLNEFQQYREQLERPIQMKIEAPEVPNQHTPSFRRASGRNANNREMRDARWDSYADIGAA